MKVMLIRRAALWAAFLSVGAALGCGSTPIDPADLDGDGSVSFDERYYYDGPIEAKAARYPPCGPEVPFSLALTAVDVDAETVPDPDPDLQPSLERRTYEAYYVYYDAYPATVTILWGSEEFISFSLNSSFPEDGKGLFLVEGSMRLGAPGITHLPVSYGSVLIMEEKIWKIYIPLEWGGTIMGVLCDNRMPE